MTKLGDTPVTRRLVSPARADGDFRWHRSSVECTVGARSTRDRGGAGGTVSQIIGTGGKAGAGFQMYAAKGHAAAVVRWEGGDPTKSFVKSSHELQSQCPPRTFTSHSHLATDAMVRLCL